MQTIRLTNSDKVAKVDDDDYQRLRGYNWYLNTSKGYARRTLPGRLQRYLHQDVTGDPPEGLEIHHKDGDKLNNSKANLDFIPHSLNGHYLKRGTNTGFHGVSVRRHKRGAVYYEYINAGLCKDRIVYNLGSFATPEDAARAYDKKASELYGSNAILNFP